MEIELPEYMHRLEKNDPEKYQKFLERLATEGFLLIEKLKESDPEQYEKVLGIMERECFVRVVRCKDCKHRKEYECTKLSVDGTKVGVNDDWFCADGELKC